MLSFFRAFKQNSGVVSQLVDFPIVPLGAESDANVSVAVLLNVSCTL